MRRADWLAWLVLTVWGLPLLSQGVADAHEDTAAVVVKEEALRESEAETIARCLKDLDSGDVAVRRRAALLLGKYSAPSAVEAMGRCLRDKDDEIRFGALVTLTETNTVPEVVVQCLPELLRDGNVHIRRLASAKLSEMQSGGRPRPQIRNGRIVQVGGMKSEERSVLRSAVLAALSDEDTAVRRNILSGGRWFNDFFQMKDILPFLKDSDPQIRILALLLCQHLNLADFELLTKELLPLVKDHSREVRMALCETAKGFAVEAVLQQLIGDPDPTLRLRALEAVVAIRRTAENYARLRSAIDDEANPLEERRRLVSQLYLFGEESLEFCKQLAAGTNAVLAEEALKTLDRQDKTKTPPSFFIRLLDSEQDRIVRQAAFSIRRRMRELTAEDVTLMMKCRRSEGRQLALQIGMHAVPRKDAGEFLLEACLDEEPLVRCDALRLLVSYRPEGWQDVLLASLEDPDALIRDAAAQQLCRSPSHAVKEALKVYLPKCENVQIRKRVMSVLGMQ